MVNDISDIIVRDDIHVCTENGKEYSMMLAPNIIYMISVEMSSLHASLWNGNLI